MCMCMYVRVHYNSEKPGFIISSSISTHAGSLLLEQFKIGFPVGVVVGLIIGVLLTGLISFCCCWRKYSQLRRETVRIITIVHIHTV